MIKSKLPLASQCDAFKIIFEKALKIDENSQVIVIYDETFSQFFEALCKVANDLLLSVTYIFTPASYQYVLINNDKFNTEGKVELPNGLRTSINNTDVIISFLSHDINTFRFRKAILNQPKTKDCKVIHSPGLSHEVLSLILKTDFDEILIESEMMAWALGSAHSAQLITTDQKNNTYVLNLNLEGWKNEPLMSPGEIFKGSWGNIPPGETFCCPTPSEVNGQICINGSIPEHVLNKDTEIVLTFTQGKLTKFDAPKNSPSYKFFKGLKEKAKERNDANWNSFAELGIGLNSAIKKLTGISLFDEKMGGSIHIAIGGNTIFGHKIDSDIHIDVVSLCPTLVLDGHTIIDQGLFKSDTITEWRNNFKFPSYDIKNETNFSINAAKADIRDGVIKRKLDRVNRVGYVEIDLDRHRVVVSKFIEIFSHDHTISYPELLAMVGRENDSILKELIGILLHYEILEIIN